MENRLIYQTQYSSPDLEYLSREQLGSLHRQSSLQMSPIKDDSILNSFDNNQLMEAINKIEKENKNIYLENLLFSRYLLRVESSKVIETFDEYEDENDIILSERHVTPDQTTFIVKLPEIARRSSVKRTSMNSSRAASLWSKLVTNWREYIHSPFLFYVEREKLSIAAYEIEQTKLDWNRMKTNATLALDHLDILLRTAESDENAEQALNHVLTKGLKKYQYNNNNQENFNKSRLIISMEEFISHINKRIHSCNRLIGLSHIDTANMQLRIRTMDTAIHDLDDLRDKMDEIDINFARTRKIDYLDIHEKLDTKYKIEKSSRYPLIQHLHKYKKILFEQEQEKANYEYKYELLIKHLKIINNEINSIEYENKFILNQNHFLTNQIADIKKVPTITEYAHVIEQIKKLQHGIHIWTQRVRIAEVSYIY